MKNRARSWVALGVILVVYSVVAFAPPFVKNGVFWLSYVFGVVAIAVQLYVMHTAFAKGKSVKSKFYGFPVANVGIIYMLVQLAFGILMMIFAAKLPLWIPLIVDVVMLGAAAVGFIAADAMRDEVERQDGRVRYACAAITRRCAGKPVQQHRCDCRRTQPCGGSALQRPNLQRSDRRKRKAARIPDG